MRYPEIKSSRLKEFAMVMLGVVEDTYIDWGTCAEKERL